MADEVLYSGVACITDLMVKDGLINLDFADVRSVMREMGKAMMGTGEASGDKRAIEAAEKAISNPLLDDVCMRGAKGLLISITGGRDMTLFEVDEAASRVREEVEADANIIFGATFDESLEGIIRVSVVATGIEQERVQEQVAPPTAGMAELTRRLKSVARRPRRAVGASVPQQPQRGDRAGLCAGGARAGACRCRSRQAPQPRLRRGAAPGAAHAQPAPGRRPVRSGSGRSVPTRRSSRRAMPRSRPSISAPTRRRARQRPRTSSRPRPSVRRKCRRACRGGGFPGRGAAADAGAAGAASRRPRRSGGRAGCSPG